MEIIMVPSTLISIIKNLDILSDDILDKEKTVLVSYVANILHYIKSRASIRFRMYILLYVLSVVDCTAVQQVWVA